MTTKERTINSNAAPRADSHRTGPPAPEPPADQTIDFPIRRVLAEDGSVVGVDPQLPDDELMRIHHGMVLTRKFDERMLTMQRQGKMGTFAPGFGQEATQIGQVYPLTEQDWFSPSYRSFGAQIWRGWEMERLLLLWAGYHEGFAPPPGLRDLPFSIVIGSHVLPAVGIAMGMQYQGDPGVVVVNFGDGALSQGPVAEALNFAAVSKAPVIFVCENNGYAISMPTDKQCAHESLAQRGVGFDVPSVRVDGNDALAMVSASTEAAERARRGDGPTFIEAVTYRMGVHTTADDPKVYREDAEVEEWERRCPIRRYEAYLSGRGLIDETRATAIAEQCEKDVLAARDRFLETAKAKPEEAFDFMFEHMSPELREQQAEYFARLRRKGVIK